jgi:hypothetical protein
VLEVHERVIAPDLAAQILARDDGTRLSQEQSQDPEGLVGQEETIPLSNQLAGLQIQREVAEVENLRPRRCERHGHLLLKPRKHYQSAARGSFHLRFTFKSPSLH